MKDDRTSRRRQSFRKNLTAAFTLVEMLTVMGVVSVLIAIAVPNMRGINQTAARRNAVTGVMNALDRARVMAISDGRATYVVFARKTDGPTQVNSSLWGQGYAIFQDKDNIDFQPIQITPWLYLPNSMAFKVNNILSVMNRPIDGNDPEFPLTASAGTGKARLPYMKFEPTGMVDDRSISQSSEYLRVLMFPGSISSSGAEVANQSGGVSTAVLLEEIDIKPMTGRAQYVADPVDNLATPTPTPN